VRSAYGEGSLILPRRCREFNDLSLAIAGGARHIDNSSLITHPALTKALTATTHLRDQSDELSYLKLWLTDDFLTTLVLPAINSGMALRRKGLAKSYAYRRHEVTLPELWCWLASYFALHLKSFNFLDESTVDAMRMLARATGKNRRKKINGASQFTDDCIAEMSTYFTQHATQQVIAGTSVTIDETMLQYFGRDAKKAKIWRRIADKPHGKGLISYRAVVRLRHSDRRVIVGLLPLLSHSKFTPTEAALTLVRNIRPSFRAGMHVFLDSGFATKEMFAALPLEHVAYIICVKGSFVGPFGALVAAASEGLPVGRVRTISFNEQIIQSINKPKDSDHDAPYLTTVVSTGYTFAHADHVRLRHVMSYDVAVQMWKTSSLSELRIAAPHVVADSMREFILEWLGWDVLAPPPDAAQRQSWTRDGLEKMDKEQLTTLSRCTQGCPASSSLNKDQLVTNLMAHLPHILRAEPPQRQRDASAAEIGNLRGQLDLQTSESGVVITNYDRFKTTVDISNEDIYHNIFLAGHRHAARLLPMSVIHAMVLNAWAMHDEAVASSLQHRNPHISTKDLHAQRLSFCSFVCNAFRHAVAQYKTA